MLHRKKIRLSGPQPSGLSITRDNAGVPHIDAPDFKAALWGSGYAHATDRTSQLLLMRILGQGRVCELLSDDDDSLEIDKFFRRANWANGADHQMAKLDAKAIALCQSYCDGVNAGLSAKRLSALKLLGYEPEPWTIADIMLISRMAAYLTLAQSQAEVERFFIELTQAGVATELLAELFPIDLKTFDRSLIEKVTLDERIVSKDVIWNLALPRMMASNNWVVSGSRTKSGKPIMANDPHLEVNRLPNVWCEQSLNWGDNFLMGMGMPGMPGILIGRSKYVAWGATYTFMDTVDSWVEECRQGEYIKDNEWHAFTERQEIIKRKKHKNEALSFYENDHGVLEGNPFVEGFYLATRWSGAESGARSLQASLNMSVVKTAQETMDTLGLIESGWNWVITDVEENIAYQMSGLMPKRPPNWNGFAPAPGWDSAYDWSGFVDYSNLPNSYNPESGFIVTANQDLNHLGQVDPINMPMGSYRAERIADVLSSHEQHSVSSTQDLQMDVYSKQAELFLNVLLPLLEQREESGGLFDVLRNWDLKYDYESIGAPVFEAFYEELRQLVFGEQAHGLGESVVEHLTNETGLFIDFYQNFDRVLLNPESKWFDSLSLEQAYQNAFDRICKRSEFQSSATLPKWKSINTVVFKNILFQGKLPKVLGFDSDRLPLLGGRATPHQGQVYRAGGRDTSFAPSVRLVADMIEDDMHTSVAGGPSDNRFSPWYTSSLEDWMQGRYKRLSAKC